MNMSIWHLLWIIPLTGSFGAMFMALFVAAGEEDRRMERLHEHLYRDATAAPVDPSDPTAGCHYPTDPQPGSQPPGGQEGGDSH